MAISLIDNGAWTTGFPKQLELNDAMIKRGQNRFNIYCSACHGHDGQGHGTVAQRVAASGGAAFLPATLVAAGGSAVQMPNGQLFNTISNGFNTMMGYANQIPHADRWAIVLYVRALQRSQHATIEDVPPEQRGSIR